MRILFITNEVPYPPDNGVRIVTHNAMRLMAAAGHELALAVLTEDPEHASTYFESAAALCKEGMAFWMPTKRRCRLSLIMSAICGNRMMFLERFRSLPFRKAVQRLIKDFHPDVIHFDLIPMTQYVDVKHRDNGAVASINDSWALALENALGSGRFKGASRLFRLVELWRVRRYEAKTYPLFQFVHVMSQQDASYLQRYSVGIRTIVIPNGSDESLLDIADGTYGRADIVFVGQLSGDNLYSLQQFLGHCWPQIRGRAPSVKLYVVGRLSQEAREWFSREVQDENVIVRGYVKDVRDIYRKCGITIVPVNKDCGILNKAIEGMAAGTAVVGFRRAFSGIEGAQDGVHFVGANDAHELANRLVDVIKNTELRCRIQKNAHEFARARLSWSGRKEAYENMYRAAARLAQNMS